MIEWEDDVVEYDVHRQLAALRDELSTVAGLLSECSARVQELADRPVDEIKPALDELLGDLAVALEAAGGGDDG